MSLIPRDTLFDFNDLLESFWAPSRFMAEAKTTHFSPKVDIKENKDHYDISAELPGVKKEDIHVTLNNGVLSISAESHQEDKEEKNGKIVRQERRYGKFLRSFNLGTDVQESDIQANFTDGVLTLSLPKQEKTAPQSRRIDIS